VAKSRFLQRFTIFSRLKAFMEKSIDSVQSLWSKIRGYNCFGCDPQSFWARFELLPARIRYPFAFKLPHHFSSYPGVVHGGIVAAVLDEVMGNVLLMKAKLYTPLFAT